ncbi:Capping protein, partial [Nibea albiflora]
DQISELLKPQRVCLVMPVVLNHSGQSCGRSAKRFVIVLETDRQILSFSVLHIKDLEDMVCHMTASLKRIFPDSSPGKLLKMIPPDLQERLLTQMAVIEEQLNSQPGFCGGFSDTYAALCDFNEMPSREEIRWSVDIQQQLTFLLSRSPSLEELSLETSGLKLDFALKMAAALREHTSSTLQSISLSGNPIEDKGLGCLSQVLSSNQLFSTSLSHLDLSGNPGSLVTEEATLFVSLSAGCCYKLVHLNLARNPFSHRNFTLQQVALPLADITQSYRSNPDRTKEALFKVQGVCRQLEDSLQRLNHCNIQEVHADIQTAHEVLHNAKESFKLLPSLYEVGRTCASDGDMVNSILTDTATALTDEFQRSIQELAQDLMRCAEAVCPRVVQRSSVYEYLSECVSKRSRQTQAFLRSTLVENTGHIISLLDADWEQQTRDRGAEREKGGGAGEEGGRGCGLLQLPVATALSVTASSPAPSPTTSQSPSPPGWTGKRRREGKVVAVDAAAAISGARGASFIPPPSLPLLYSISAQAPEEEAAGCGGLPRREVPFPGCGPSLSPLPPSSGSPASPMEPLPTQGQTLRHYTASRPRPRRTHTQPPSSRPQVR